jgi:hypothetical protein
VSTSAPPNIFGKRIVVLQLKRITTQQVEVYGLSMHQEGKMVASLISVGRNEISRSYEGSALKPQLTTASHATLNL